MYHRGRCRVGLGCGIHCLAPAASAMAWAAGGSGSVGLTMKRVAMSIVQFCGAHSFLTGAVPATMPGSGIGQPGTTVDRIASTATHACMRRRWRSVCTISMRSVKQCDR